ncbi:hypothetical protein JIN84_22535 [Luteolibacter yonseiensis]|uniref:Uncharacterized protein n=1 Tax=Luteolibacter yonseiensis TaxID=1144680 RepID=A0A934R9J7_9BACT|nr:hypothetical protein [Luteolibacter yonseiensis]MBK1818413.1 hypothetical protein [Luteolibacter yonseiensis]
MKLILPLLTAAFCSLHPVAGADAPLPSKKLALDVIEWARHGSNRFTARYSDQSLFAKKKNFVLYGEIFEKMARNGELPEGYSLVTNETLGKVDWSATGMISVGKQSPEGGFEVKLALGPLGMCAYRIIPQEGGYKVRSDGGS